MYFIRSLALVLCALTVAAAPTSQPGVFNVMDYGAVADGTTLTTEAIQKAIDTCAASGGGQVVIPAGTYLCAPLVLRSNVDLHVDAGAIVLFSRNHADYPLDLSNYEGREAVRCRAPLTGSNLQNVSITGPGIFDGQGDSWRPVKRSKLTDDQWDALVKSGGVTDDDQTQWWPSQIARDGFRDLAALQRQPGTPKIEDFIPYRDLLRPSLIMISDTHHLRLEGPTFRNSGAWNVHLLDSDDITVRGVNLYNPLYAQNGDGIDVDSCKDVLIENSTVHAGDDDICLKSGRDEEGRKHNRPTENVIIRNNIIGWGHGGVAIGSEMSGGVRNVEVYYCTMDGTDVGLRFKTTRGRGGVVENIRIHDVKMSNITNTAILFDMYYMERNPKPEPVSERTPIFRDITIKDVTCDGAKRGLFIRGLAELPMSQITLENVSINSDAGASLSDAQDITFRNLSIHAKTLPVIQYQDVSGLHVENLDAVASSDAKPQEQAK
jgi:polygalacturonase